MKWSNDGQVYWRIYMSLYAATFRSLIEKSNEFTHQYAYSLAVTPVFREYVAPRVLSQYVQSPLKTREEKSI